jgi:hypothetical protein
MTGATTNSIPMAVFGPGSLFVTRNDSGAVGAQPTVNIGYAQEFSYDEASETKELYGQNQYPLVIARGTIKATGKIKAATISGLALSTVFFGQNFASGVLRAALGESHLIPATPFTVVVAPPSSGVFDRDLGVINASTGLPMLPITLGGTPAAGQYTVDPATGTYLFSSADNVSGYSALISYAYSVAATGQKLIVANTPIGTTPTFQIDYVSSLYGVTYYARFFACVSSKLTNSHKLTDFDMPEIDFGFFANSLGKVYEISMDVAA